VSEKAKRVPTGYTIDFVTALPIDDCRDRLERGAMLHPKSTGSWLAPVEQRTQVLKDNSFVIERTFPGAIHPIRLIGHLDRDDASPGTWVHGAVTHDTYNQVLIEGLLVFLTFFMLAALLFLRLKAEGIMMAVVLLLATLSIFTLRWRALRAATEDAALWVRRRLYVTAGQVRK
jgi:hypothetical protein